jgi:outer membrane protein assembly factor BamB
MTLSWKNENGTIVVLPSRGHTDRVDFPLPETGWRLSDAKGGNKGAFVIARDAYNGRMLWIRAMGKPRRSKKYTYCLEAVGDRVYTMAEDKLVALNGATGELVRTYEGLPPVMPKVHQGVLLFFEGNYKNPSITAADAETGKVLWQAPIDNVQLGDGAVFGRKGGKGPLVCLDLKTGTERWSREDVKGGLRACGNGVLLMTSHHHGNMYALSCKDGKSLWDKTLWGSGGRRAWTHGKEVTWGKPPANVDAVPQPMEKPYYNRDMIYILEGRVWVSGFQEYANPRVLPVFEKPAFIPGRIHFHGYGAYHWGYDPRILRTMFWVGIDPLTGEEVARFEYPKDIPLRTFGCSLPQGKARFIHGEPRGLMDVRTGKWLPVPATRAACVHGYYLGEGITFSPPCHCGCYPHIPRRGYMAVAPLEWETAWNEKDRDAGQLERGPAFGTVSPDAGEVTFSIEENGHLVEARDAGSNAARWTFTAAGRIDTPPVVCEGVALVGSRDGYVYALRASDGALVWRFRGAPRERRVVTYGQLESAWPIVGGVLTADGTAYFVAGLHSEFPEGVSVYAMKPQDGTIVWKKRFDEKGGTSYRGGPSWGDVVVAAKPVRDGTRLIIPNKLNLPAKPIRPVDGLGGKILDLKTGKIEKPIGGRFYKVNDPKHKMTFIFDGKLKIWKEVETGVDSTELHN